MLERYAGEVVIWAVGSRCIAGCFVSIVAWSLVRMGRWIDDGFKEAGRSCSDSMGVSIFMKLYVF